jgi:hypothetical protein
VGGNPSSLTKGTTYFLDDGTSGLSFLSTADAVP